MAGGIDWYRWHHGSVTDPKFQLVARRAGASLPDVLAVWAYLLETASSSAERGTFTEIDCEAWDCLFGFPSTETRTADILAAMRQRGLIGDGEVVSWDKRQPKRERDASDTSTSRVQAHRATKRQETPSAPDGTPRNTTERQETPRGEESREEKRRESKGETEVVAAAAASPNPAPDPVVSAEPPQAPPDSPPPRATRLPAGFVVPEDWRLWAAEQFAAWPEGAVDNEASKFVDYWAALPGKAGLKLDWLGTWRNWCRSARVAPPARASPGRKTWTEQQTETIAGLTGRVKRAEVIDVVATRVG